MKVIKLGKVEGRSEQKYLITMEMNRMSQLVGVPEHEIRRLLESQNTQPSYGVAHGRSYFEDRANKFRRLSLNELHVRIDSPATGLKLDASGSFVIATVIIMDTAVVGELDENGSGYELMPHITAISGDSAAPTHTYLFGSATPPGVLRENMYYQLSGFDLMLFDTIEDRAAFERESLIDSLVDQIEKAAEFNKSPIPYQQVTKDLGFGYSIITRIDLTGEENDRPGVHLELYHVTEEKPLYTEEYSLPVFGLPELPEFLRRAMLDADAGSNACAALPNMFQLLVSDFCN